MSLLLAAATRWLPNAPEWLSSEVLICGAAAVGLLLLSLALKGLQKIISLALAIALVLGVFWFLRDAWKNKEKFLSPSAAAQLDSLADKTLRSPQAVAAWESVKEQLTKFAASASRESTPEERRKAVADELTARAAELRKDGHRAAAAELLKLRDEMKP